MEDEKIIVSLKPDVIEQGNNEEQVKNTITVLMRNGSKQSVDPNEVDICLKIPYGDTDDDLVFIDNIDMVMAVCENEGFSLVKEIDDSFIIWKLQANGVIFESDKSLEISIQQIVCPLQENEASCMSYIRLDVDEDISIYEVIKLRKVNIKIHEWIIKNKEKLVDYQAGFGELITLKWKTNAGKCIIYPYGIEVSSEGEYSMKIYEDTQFTLRAIKNNVETTNTLSVNIVDQEPKINSFKVTMQKDITFHCDYIGTSYAYINKSVGRLENEKEITIPAFCNRTGFQLTLITGKNKEDVTSNTSSGANNIIELDYLSYIMSISNGKITYQASWVLINCEDTKVSIKRIDEFGKATEISTNPEGNINFTSDRDWIIPLYIEVLNKEGQLIYHLSELYPWNPWEESGRTTRQCYK